jgi:hypothetical protein
MYIVVLLSNNLSCYYYYFQLSEQCKTDKAESWRAIENLQNELSKAQASAAYYQLQYEAKEVACIKADQQNHFEVMKFEKKIAEQVRLA